MSQDTQSTWEERFFEKFNHAAFSGYLAPGIKAVLPDIKEFISQEIATLNADHQKLVLEAEKECRERTLEEVAKELRRRILKIEEILTIEDKLLLRINPSELENGTASLFTGDPINWIIELQALKSQSL